MKAILEFNLDDPEDAKAHLRCVKAFDMALLLSDIEQERRKLINGKCSEKIAIHNILIALDETDLNLDELV